MPVAGYRGTSEQRFWVKVRKTDTCWLWIGGVTSAGYGMFWVPPNNVTAHRCSWELAYGPIPQGQWVLHRCDVPLCVNPKHLFLGDQTVNMRDMAMKGRYPRKLTDTDVLEIRVSKDAQKEIARVYNITQSTVSKIKRNMIWRHI